MRLPTQLLRRKPDAHKGNFGHIFILAGSLRFSGAAVLCSDAAIRSGAGLVTLGIPESLSRAVIKIKPKEAMILPLAETKDGALSLSGYKRIKDFAQKQADVLALGPGLSRNSSTQNLVRKITSNINKPMIIDADGLNALVGHLDLLRVTKSQSHGSTGSPSLEPSRAKSRGNVTRILTPHPGEMARLLGISVREVEADRKNIAKKFAADFNLTVILKGRHTVVADYKGELFINKTGNPGMATAGSGDVLTGMVAAFLGQGLDSFRAAKYAVYLHGLAGDLAAGDKTQIGMVASDIIDKIPEAIKKCS